MICQNCGTENKDDAAFCKSCGKHLTKKLIDVNRAATAFLIFGVLFYISVSISHPIGASEAGSATAAPFIVAVVYYFSGNYSAKKSENYFVDKDGNKKSEKPKKPIS
jgi:uncharacterized membrane protein YvbJ